MNDQVNNTASPTDPNKTIASLLSISADCFNSPVPKAKDEHCKVQKKTTALNSEIENKMVPSDDMGADYLPNNMCLQTDKQVVKVKTADCFLSEAQQNRCNVCNKKVGLMYIPCQCSGIFCPKHRSDKEHECPFDYKKSDTDMLACNLNVVKSDKLHGRI